MSKWQKAVAMAGLMLMAGWMPALAAKTMSVQVRSGQVRATASFLGTVVADVAYGDQVEVLQQQGVWMQVKTAPGKTGWIHQSALSKKKIVMTAGNEDVQTGASGDELALAGKGFNSDVEAQFKEQNKDIDFSWVDRMEKIIVSPAEQREFLKEGDVKPVQGGVQ